MAPKPKYTAFISYSRADEDAVRRLYRRLTDYRLPKKFRGPNGDASLGRFFLDKEELGAAGELDEELYEKLDEADRLIVCCSPAAAKSKWVDAEAQAFIERRGRDRLLAVVLNGEPHDAFPPSLMADEPLAADFRAQGDGEEHGFLKLVAGLLYVDLGELRDLQAKAERRRTAIRNGLIGLFAALAVFSVIMAVIAVMGNRKAQKMTAEAVDISTGIVAKTEALSRKFGVPTSALKELLSFADTRFTRLFEQGVPSTDMRQGQMGLAVEFSKLYSRVGDAQEAADRASDAVALLRSIPRQAVRSIDYVEVLSTYGDAVHAVGRRDDAETAYADAVAAARKMLADIPDGRLARNRLSGVLQRLGHLYVDDGRPVDALPLFREAHQRQQEIVEMDPQDGLAIANAIIALNAIGSAASLSGQPQAGVKAFEESIAQAEAFLKTSPDSLPALNALGSAQMKLAQALADLKRPDEARRWFEQSVAAAQKLVDADPKDAKQQADLALRRVLLANLDFRRGAYREAIDGLRVGAEQYEALIAQDPENVARRVSYARALAVEAEALAKLKDRPKSLARRGRAAALWATIVDVETEVRPDRLTSLATAYELWGDAAAQARDLEQMLAAYTKAEPARDRLRTLQDTPAHQRSYASVLHALGLTQKFAKAFDKSVASLSKAAEIRRGLDADDDRFGAAESYQQLGLVQANHDGAASKASFLKAKAILVELLKKQPNNERYKASLAKTDNVLALFEKN